MSNLFRFITFFLLLALIAGAALYFLEMVDGPVAQFSVLLLAVLAGVVVGTIKTTRAGRKLIPPIVQEYKDLGHQVPYRRIGVLLQVKDGPRQGELCVMNVGNELPPREFYWHEHEERLIGID